MICEKWLVGVIAIFSTCLAASAQTAPRVGYGSQNVRPGNYVPEPDRLDKEKPVQAKPSELRSGFIVRDKTGKSIGTITAVDAEGAVLNYGSGSTKVPLRAFGKTTSGLVMAMTRSEFLEKAANPK